MSRPQTPAAVDSPPELNSASAEASGLHGREHSTPTMAGLSLTMLGIALWDLNDHAQDSSWLTMTTALYGVAGLALSAWLWKRKLSPAAVPQLLMGNWCVLWLNAVVRATVLPESSFATLAVFVLAAAGWCAHTHLSYGGLMAFAVATTLGMTRSSPAHSLLNEGSWLLPLGVLFGWRMLAYRLTTARQWIALEEHHRQSRSSLQGMLISLQVNEERFRMLSETVPVGVFQTDDQGTVIYTNTSWRRITGTTFRDSAIAEWTQYLHPEDRRSIREAWLAALRAGDTFDRECRLGNEPGHQRWIKIHSCPNYADSGTTFVGVIEETTQRRLDAEATRRHAEYLQAAQQNEAKNALRLAEVVAQLDDARREAIEATRAKSEFLANMSHEIRTPMTAVLGYTDMLMEQTASQPALQDQLQTIKRNGEYLLEIINDILDLSKVEAGKLEIEQVRCSPRQIIGDVISLMQVRAKAKGLKLSKVIDGPFPQTMDTDPTRLRQIMLNLISNSLKFTSSGSVTVRMGYEGSTESANGVGRIRLSVEDTGLGMTTEQVAKLFRPFTQADQTTTRQFGGTGLGLTICKRFAEMMGGDILVESTSGNGSTFTVTLPAHAAANIVSIVESADMPAPAFLPTGAATASSSTSVTESIQVPCRVLVAEDGADNQRLIQFILKKAGATVQVVENGQLAVDAVEAAITENRPFDLVLMDMSMPVMDGYSATRELRQRGHHLPIIALTAHAMSSDRDKCLAAGCNDYTTKPLNRTVLLEVIRRHIGSDSSDVSTPSEVIADRG
ncbi:MAG TPA: ATP-binding protein [Planctomycetaceae bacterium]|nr:ATP-binding protein [Planctomycetaceae bacterium]